MPSLSSELICFDPKSFVRRRLSSKLSSEDVMRAASTRLVSLGDVEAREGDEFNMQHVKVLTGGDEFNGIKVHTTLVMTLNKLFHYRDLSTFILPDRLRRVVVVPTVEERIGVNVDSTPLHQESLDELIA